MHSYLVRPAGFGADFKKTEFHPLGLWPLSLRRARLLDVSLPAKGGRREGEPLEYPVFGYRFPQFPSRPAPRKMSPKVLRTATYGLIYYPVVILYKTIYNSNIRLFNSSFLVRQPAFSF